MRKHGRVDSNHAAVVTALRKIGCSVQSLADVGNGCPDLLVGYHGENYALEVKVPGADLTPDEEAWEERWVGNYAVVHSAQEAINFVLASGR